MAGFRETISVAEDFTWSDCYGRNSGRQELVSCRKSGPVRKRQRTAALQDAPRPNEADEFPKVLECGSPLPLSINVRKLIRAQEQVAVIEPVVFSIAKD